MENKIYIGDSYEILKKLPDNFFQLMVTSPPYWNDWILDPFLGSGSSMRAANELNRNCVGIELNPDFLEIIKKRFIFIKMIFLAKINLKVIVADPLLKCYNLKSTLLNYLSD